MRRSRPYEAVVMVASSGGIQAVREVLAGLHARLAVPLMLVQHTASSDGTALCEVLSTCSALPVVEAESRQPVIGGCVYLAPPGYHLLVESGPRFALNVDDRVCHVRPSADVLFQSAADLWKDRLIAVVLTGANDDGARGLADVRSRRGLAVVQAPQEAEMREMPEAGLRLAGADHVLKLAQIGPLISELCRKQSVRKEVRAR